MKITKHAVVLVPRVRIEASARVTLMPAEDVS